MPTIRLIDRLAPLAGDDTLTIFASRPRLAAGGDADADADQPPASLTLSEPASVEFRAAEAAGEGDAGPKLPTFSMIAHTFKPVRLSGWFYPVVVDAAGMSIPRQTRPIRYNHDADQGVGHTTLIEIRDGKLVAEGVISRDTEAARDVVGSAKNGFPWQASIGASVEEYEFIREKQKVTVNGVEYSGPMTVARKTTLNEISFVDLGADDRTKAKVAAGAKDGSGGGDGDDDTFDGPPADGAGATRQALARAKAERERQRAIQALVEEELAYRGANVEVIERVAAKALDEGWTVKDTQIALLRETRPKAPSPRRADAPKPKVLEAALCMACGLSDERLAKDRDYGEDIVAQAYPLRGDGLHGTIRAALEAMGLPVPHGKTALFNAFVEACQIRASGFSTVNLPGILGNVANKVILDAFTAVEATYPLIADLADFSNFHTHTIYRLGVNGTFEKVAPDGEIKHASLGEESYTNRLDTYGRMLTLSRQDIINDDLNSFRSLAAQLGRKARIAVERALYDAILESVDAFFTAARGNKNTSNGLSIAALGTAEAAMAAMVDTDGDPLYAMPTRILVPPGVKPLAERIYTADTLTGTTDVVPTTNPYRGRFTVVSSPFLASASLAGSSATTWYMLANPSILPAFQVAFLDGKRAPTVETADAAFNTLGMSMRCYFDFGVAQLDYRGANKNVA